MKEAVVVLGAHRSGTSALARALNLCGLGMADHIVEMRDGSAEEFWEDRKVVELHDQLLFAASATWDSFEAIELEHVPARRKAEFLQELEGHFEREYRSHRQIVIKDPRACRFTSLWAEFFSGRGTNAHYAIILRNPVEVCASLGVRDGLPSLHAGLLWLRHVVDSLSVVGSEDHAIVSYEQLLEDPAEVCAAILTAFQIDPPSGLRADRDRLRESIRPEKRNWIATGDPIGIQALLTSVYDSILRCRNDRRGLQKLRQHVCESTFPTLRACHDELLSSDGKAGPSHARLYQNFQEAKVYSNSLKLALDEKNNYLEHLEKQLQAKEADLQSLENSCKASQVEAERYAVALEKEIACQADHQAEALRYISSLESEISRHRSRLQDSENHMSSVLDVLKAKDQELAIAHASLVERQSRLDQVALELESLRQELAQPGWKFLRRKLTSRLFGRNVE